MGKLEAEAQRAAASAQREQAQAEGQRFHDMKTQAEPASEWCGLDGRQSAGGSEKGDARQRGVCRHRSAGESSARF